MVHVTNPEPHQLWVPALGRNVAAGETVEVSEDVAVRLLGAGWKKAPAAKPAKTEED